MIASVSKRGGGMNSQFPVVTIDGPSGTGKGTVAKRLALVKGWHYLDSGAVYRAFAWFVLQSGVELPDEKTCLDLFDRSFDLDFRFTDEGVYQVFVGETDITDSIRQENIGLQASVLSSNNLIRNKLLDFQLRYCRSPGLVTDGRDMGTVVFPEASYKFYLTADVNERAKRRYKQLQEQGISGNLRNIESDLSKRDLRDSSRLVSPMKPAPDALIIDTTHMTIEHVMNKVLSYIESA